MNVGTRKTLASFVLGQQTYVIDRPTHLPVGEFEGGNRGAAHHLKPGENDETDAVHGVALRECPKTPCI